MNSMDADLPLVQQHYRYMFQAFKLAEQAYEEGEIPVGAVVVHNDRIIGRGYNQVERLHDPTAHAEILAISAACDTLDSKYLKDCTLYVTLEPCPMCAAALRWAQVGRVVYGASDEKSGYLRYNKTLLHPKTELTTDILADESRELMQAFFREKR